MEKWNKRTLLKVPQDYGKFERKKKTKPQSLCLKVEVTAGSTDELSWHISNKWQESYTWKKRVSVLAMVANLAMLGEGKRDIMQRQELKQLILYLKNNKQPVFFFSTLESGNKVKGVKN